MRDRKLSREEAIEEYLVYQLRTYEFLHMFQILIDIMDGKYKPESPMGHATNEFIGSLRTAATGIFASLMDNSNVALNVFDVWVVLYPDRESDIVAVWKAVEPHIKTIREYRNEVAFHANKDLRRYVETRRKFRAKQKEIVDAMQQFLGLAADLIRNQAAAVPDFRVEIEPALRKAFPDIGAEELEQLKDYFIQGD